ncbi:MAG: M55 family metallopeptidase, partial [Alphaproteobacteria bacterium]|nr:M55 family metallopeptidase [Alphaproteobacteria bacterium]
ESFDAVMMVGYHSEAGSEANSLAHTLSSDAVAIRINGKAASEFTVHALASSMLGVPTVFVSGDKGLIDHVAEASPHITGCAVKEGRGQSTITMTPSAAVKAIRQGAEASLEGDLSKCLLHIPDHLAVEITYGNPVLAYRHSWYPGMVHAGERTIRFESENYFDVLRMLNYVT